LIDALYYTKDKPDPQCVVLLSYVLPGHVYPTIESLDTWEYNINGEKKWIHAGSHEKKPIIENAMHIKYRGLTGAACIKGHQSHYVHVLGNSKCMYLHVFKRTFVVKITSLLLKYFKFLMESSQMNQIFQCNTKKFKNSNIC